MLAERERVALARKLSPPPELESLLPHHGRLRTPVAFPVPRCDALQDGMQFSLSTLDDVSKWSHECVCVCVCVCDSCNRWLGICLFPPHSMSRGLRVAALALVCVCVLLLACLWPRAPVTERCLQLCSRRPLG